MSSLVPEQTGEAVGLPKRYLIRFGCVAESGFAFLLDFNAGSHHSTASKDCCDSGPSWSKPDEPSVSVAISLRQIRCRKNLVGHRASHFDVSLFGDLHRAFLYIDVTVCVCELAGTSACRLGSGIGRTVFCCGMSSPDGFVWAHCEWETRVAGMH